MRLEPVIDFKVGIFLKIYFLFKNTQNYKKKKKSLIKSTELDLFELKLPRLVGNVADAIEIGGYGNDIDELETITDEACFTPPPPPPRPPLPPRPAPMPLFPSFMS